MKTILCVDDQPNTLKTVLREIYGKNFRLDFAADWRSYNRKLKADAKKDDIALVLLDHDLNSKFINNGQDWDGPEVADDLFERRPDLKFIGLTRVSDSDYSGKKADTEMKSRQIEFGHKNNKAAFFKKSELQTKQKYLFNISKAIIEDYENKQWSASWCSGKASLILQKDGQEIIVHVPNKKGIGGISLHQMLVVALRTPNSFVGPFPSSARVVDEANKAIREKSSGCLWGILSTADAPTACFKALIGASSIDYTGAPVCDQTASNQVRCAVMLEKITKKIDEHEINLNKMSILVNGYVKYIQNASDAIGAVVKDFPAKTRL